MSNFLFESGKAKANNGSQLQLFFTKRLVSRLRVTRSGQSYQFHVKPIFVNVAYRSNDVIDYSNISVIQNYISIVHAPNGCHAPLLTLSLSSEGQSSSHPKISRGTFYARSFLVMTFLQICGIDNNQNY